MKRISNIRDLEYEKLKLRVRQLELEKQMEMSWRQLVKKLSFEEPSRKKGSAPRSAHFKTRHPVLTGALNYGASFLSHKVGMFAGKKIEELAEQALEKLSNRINTAISNKKTAQ